MKAARTNCQLRNEKMRGENFHLEAAREEIVPEVCRISAEFDGLHLRHAGAAVRLHDLLTLHSIPKVLEFLVFVDRGGGGLDVGEVAVDVLVDKRIIGGRLPLDGMSMDCGEVSLTVDSHK